MAADAWVIHDKIKEYEGNGIVDYDADSFVCNLYLATSNVATTSVDPVASATNQVASANGYVQNSQGILSPTWTELAGVVTFDCADIVWTAAGGSITARYAAIYDDTVAAPVVDPIVCHSLLDNTPADVEATDTNTFTISIAVGGVFQKV